MILVLYIALVTQHLFCDSLFYQTITQILLSNKVIQTTPIQDKNIVLINKQLSTYKDALYPHIGLNYINKDKIRKYLNHHHFLIQQLLHSLNNQDQIKDITLAFLVFYRKDNLQNKQDTNLFIDAQAMYNIFYHLYNYNQNLQRKIK